MRFDLNAITKGRPRLGRRRRAYTPTATIDFENSVRELWIPDEHGRWEDNEPLGCIITLGRGWFDVELYELEESLRPVGVRGDADNYVKSILDGLQDKTLKDGSIEYGAFRNDRQIHHLDFRFTKGEAPDDVDTEGSELGEGVPMATGVPESDRPEQAATQL